MPDLFDHNEDGRRLTRQTMARLLDTVSLVGQLITESPLEGIPTPGGTVLRLAEAIPGVEVLELTGSGANSWGLQDAYIRKLLPTYAWTADSGSTNVACPPANRQVWAVDANLLPLPALPDPIPINTSGLNTSFPGSGATGRVLGLRLGNFAGRDTYAIVPSTASALPKSSAITVGGDGTNQSISGGSISQQITNMSNTSSNGTFAGGVPGSDLPTYDGAFRRFAIPALGTANMLFGLNGNFSGIATTADVRIELVIVDTNGNLLGTHPIISFQSGKSVASGQLCYLSVSGMANVPSSCYVIGRAWQNSGTTINWSTNTFWLRRLPYG